MRFQVPPNVNSVNTVPTVSVKVSIPKSMPYFWAVGRLERPKASKRAVGVSGRIERAAVSLSRSDMVGYSSVSGCRFISWWDLCGSGTTWRDEEII